MSGRHSGFRHAIEYARHARKALADGRIGPAVSDWGHARCHFGFTIGLTEGVAQTLAARLLREALGRLGEQIERAVAARVPVPGYLIAEPVLEALSPLRDAYPDIGVSALADVAANAAVEILRRYEVREKP